MQGVPRGLSCYKFIGQQERTSQIGFQTLLGKVGWKLQLDNHSSLAESETSTDSHSVPSVCQMPKDWRWLHSEASISSTLCNDVHQRSWLSVSGKTELVDGRVLLLSSRPGLLKVRLQTCSIRVTWLHSRNSSSQALPQTYWNQNLCWWGPPGDSSLCTYVRSTELMEAKYVSALRLAACQGPLHLLLLGHITWNWPMAYMLLNSG